MKNLKHIHFEQDSAIKNQSENFKNPEFGKL